jgi:hypothetical protein
MSREKIISALESYPFDSMTVQALSKRLDADFDLQITPDKLQGICNQLVDQGVLETFSRAAFGRKDVYFKTAKKGKPLESLDEAMDQFETAGKKLDIAFKGAAKCLHEDVLHDAVPMCSVCAEKIRSLESEIQKYITKTEALENELFRVENSLQNEKRLTIELQSPLSKEEDNAKQSKLSIIQMILRL